MAGDWIQMRTDLVDDPAVICMAEQLELPRDHVVGILHHLWSWADRHTTTGHVPGVTPAQLERCIGVSGLAKALLAVHWLEVWGSPPQGISFPKFERYMGSCAKKRALSALRSRKYRHAAVTQKSRLQQRREEKSNKQQQHTETTRDLAALDCGHSAAAAGCEHSEEQTDGAADRVEANRDALAAIGVTEPILTELSESEHVTPQRVETVAANAAKQPGLHNPIGLIISNLRKPSIVGAGLTAPTPPSWTFVNGPNKADIERQKQLPGNDARYEAEWQLGREVCDTQPEAATRELEALKQEAPTEVHRRMLERGGLDGNVRQIAARIVGQHDFDRRVEAILAATSGIDRR
jgi:hypothetical protein